jgi:hypothetical protein
MILDILFWSVIGLMALNGLLLIAAMGLRYALDLCAPEYPQTIAIDRAALDGEPT